jgi:hypothetical protein
MGVSLGDADLVDGLALPQRDVAVGAAEVAVERERDVLGDGKAPVAPDLDDDVRARQRERLRGGVSGERERAQNRDR